MADLLDKMLENTKFDPLKLPVPRKTSRYKVVKDLAIRKGFTIVQP